MQKSQISNLLASFLKEHKILRQFKYNSSLYIFKEGRCKADKIMNYINPKYSGAWLSSGPDIFDWGRTKEAFGFWCRMHSLWVERRRKIFE